MYLVGRHIKHTACLEHDLQRQSRSDLNPVVDGVPHCCMLVPRSRTSSPFILNRNLPLRIASRLSQLWLWSPNTQPVGKVYTEVLYPWL